MLGLEPQQKPSWALHRPPTSLLLSLGSPSVWSRVVDVGAATTYAAGQEHRVLDFSIFGSTLRVGV